MSGLEVSLISSIVLAAGKSERMQSCKQLLEIKGRTMIERVVSAARSSRVDEIIVVLGYMAEDIAQKIPYGDIKAVVNPDFEKGMSTSLKVGLGEVSEDSEAVIIILGDQPFLESWVIDKLIKRYDETGAPIVVPMHRGQKGNPVLLDMSLKGELTKLKGDTGARDIVNELWDEACTVNIGTPTVIMDINTEEDLERLRKFIKR